mgnify:CR=1 FL=1|tara:strand:- start:2314 stop:2655 length:342 start_codon:yes stop_codon:yes gene_type:complete
MNSTNYYKSQTDRERLSSSQRQLMSLQSKYDALLLKEREYLNTITDLTSKSDKDDEFRENVYHYNNSRDRICREQTPMYMVNILETCYTHIEQNVIDPILLKDLRNVIKFLQK